MPVLKELLVGIPKINHYIALRKGSICGTNVQQQRKEKEP